MNLNETLREIILYREENPNATKEQLVMHMVRGAGLKRHRSIYACESYALRFSLASGNSFSNTVASLAVVKAFDSVPFVVAVLRSGSTEFLLANATFLKMVSHSSQQLRIDNVRGSFLGHDIVREYDGLPNLPQNFEALFAIHQKFQWEENLSRLVEATSGITGTGRRFQPTENDRRRILRAPSLAVSLLSHPGYLRAKKELAAIVTEQSQAILQHATVDNVNVRGNQIERQITGGINEHGLADMVRDLGEGIGLELEIKTKLLDRASSPKGYNIDKALQTLARGNTAIAFYFVGVDLRRGEVTSSVVSIFDKAILNATRIQFHWAGRNSRGVTQLTGNIGLLFSSDYQEEVDIATAKRFLEQLLAT